MADDQKYVGGKYFSYKRKPGYNDGEAAIANNTQLFLDIWSMSAQVGLAFKAILNNFTDTFNSDLYAESVIGHTEPLRKLKTIERVISVGLDVIAADEIEAANNFRNIALFAKMMYPTGDYHESGVGRRLQVRAGGDPIFKIRFANFIHNGKAMHGNGASAKDIGQMGYIGNLSYEWDLESGFHGEAGTPWGTTYVYPQLIRVSFEFYPFHEESPAWSYQKPDQTGPAAFETIFNRPGLPYSYSSIAAGFDKYTDALRAEERERQGSGVSNLTINAVNQARINGALQGSE